MLDVRVKRGAELSTDHHLLSATCAWKNLQGLHKRAGLGCPFRIEWEALANKDVKKDFADNVSSLFRELPGCTADVSEWQL